MVSSDNFMRRKISQILFSKVNFSQDDGTSQIPTKSKSLFGLGSVGRLRLTSEMSECRRDQKSRDNTIYSLGRRVGHKNHVNFFFVN